MLQILCADCFGPPSEVFKHYNNNNNYYYTYTYNYS